MAKSLMVILLILWSILWPIEASVRFTNLKCEEYHPEFAKFLKVMRRGLISLNVDLKLFQVPVTNATVNLSLHKKVSGYRPFLYNTTFDFCKFMLNRKQEPFAKLFFDVLEKDSNINHTCPYSHNIIVDNMTVDENIFKYLPLPAGGYMFQLKFAAYILKLIENLENLLEFFRIWK